MPGLNRWGNESLHGLEIDFVDVNFKEDDIETGNDSRTSPGYRPKLRSLH